MGKMKRPKLLRTIGLFVLLIFLIISAIILFPNIAPSGIQTSQKSLVKKITKNGNKVRTDYCDDNGVVTIAADLGYATVVSTKTDNVEIEHYYNDKGEPVKLYPGYYAIRREYDQEGRNNHITYLGIDDLPVVTVEGYSDKIRTFYDTGKIRTEKYYDPEGNPVNTQAYGYGFLNKYNDKGQNTETTYLNEHNKPMVVGLGYATVKREFYDTDGPEKGKVEREFYFDENGNPQVFSMGYSGVYKKYCENGKDLFITYLDYDGKPIVTNKGYTTVFRAFYPNNYIATEMYYDIDGKPYSLLEGQYGIKYEGDKLIYLNQNGEEQFNLKKLVYNHSWTIIPFCIIIIIISWSISKRWNLVLLVFYILGIIYLTIMYREKEGSSISTFLWQYRSIFIDSEARNDIIKNIWLFIPLGAILYKLYPKSVVLLVPLFFSVLIEGIQYFVDIGFCEFDDIVSNSLGGAIGFYIERLTTVGFQRIKSWRHVHIL